MSKNKKTLIGINHFKQTELKPMYRERRFPDKHDLVSVEIYLDSKTKYGIIVELHDWHYSWNQAFSLDSLTDKQKDVRKKRQEKIEEEYKKREAKGLSAVDTSKWVYPDEESIRRELIEQLVYLELLKKTNPSFLKAYHRVGAVHSILHSHSPTNPQGLTNYAIDYLDAFEMILSELKHPERGNSYKLMDKKDETGKFNWWSWLYEVTEWRENLKKEIIKPIYLHLALDESNKYYNSNEKKLSKKEKKALRKKVEGELKKEKIERKKRWRKITTIKRKARKVVNFIPFWNREEK